MDLLPCPFCGGEATISRIISPEGEFRGDRPAFDVSCQGCWVWHRWDHEDAAITAWNTRALSAAPKEGE